MDIKVLGPGCAKCERVEKLVNEAIAEAGVDGRAKKVTNMLEIAKHGVLNTPAIVIAGKIKSSGNVPKKEEIMSWLVK